MKDDRPNRGDDAMGSMVYNKVIRMLCEAVEHTPHRPLEPGSGSPSTRFRNAVEDLKRLLTTDADRRGLAKSLDVEQGSIDAMATQLVEEEQDRTTITDIDDIAPNAVKIAMYEVAYQSGVQGERVDVPLTEFLRDALTTLFGAHQIQGRMNVGANRHFPRLLHYVRECETETRWSARDRGLWLKNAGGRGKVADHPSHPADLKLTIALDLL